MYANFIENVYKMYQKCICGLDVCDMDEKLIELWGVLGKLLERHFGDGEVQKRYLEEFKGCLFFHSLTPTVWQTGVKSFCIYDQLNKKIDELKPLAKDGSITREIYCETVKSVLGKECEVKW